MSYASYIKTEPFEEDADFDLAMNKSHNTWIVDFQYYSSDANHIFPKEISIINFFTFDNGCSFFAKSPNIDKKSLNADDAFQYQYKLHKTPWNYGDVQDWESKLKSIVGSPHWIYVKGAVKRNFLIQHGFENVMDLDINGCPALKILYRDYKLDGVNKCNFHTETRGLCSFTNVHILRKWCKCTN